MKNALKDFLLWQKKRTELPVNEDPQADWNHMQSLLDEQMPAIKKTGGFKGFRTLPALFITFSAAAMIYVAGNIYSLERHNHNAKYHFHKGSSKRAGSHFSVSDSLNRKDTTDLKEDITDSLSNNQNATNIDATLKDSIRQAAKNNGNQSAKTVPAGNPKSNNSPTSTNKTNDGSTGVTGQSAALTPQQKYDAAKSPSKDYKSRFGGSGSSHHGVVANSTDHGQNNQHQAPGENKAGGISAPRDNRGKTAAGVNDFDKTGDDSKFLIQLSITPKFDFNLGKTLPVTLPVLSSRLSQAPLQAGKQAKGSKKDKPGKLQNSKPSNIDWGILMGVNTSGSFTPKSQNANFYGSAPIDPWLGLFASYKINTDWAIASQVHFFSPQNIVTTYSHANQSKVDSNQSLSITASRKMYTVSVPIYAVYNAGNGFSLKAGPVVSFPVKQINTNSVLSPYNIRSDSVYYKNISTILNATKYQQNINFGFSAGASYQYKRFIFEATYLKSLSGYGISSGLGTYKSNSGTFQFTIGFQLDKVKP